ncbi:MAG TPA: ATP-binding protein [Hanamia sp.]|nr:ATP-binding protein [Hanamia sp.]
MKRDESHSPLWGLTISYAALFVLLVVAKNVQFWKMRSTSKQLLNIISNTQQRQSAFFNLYTYNQDEQKTLEAFVSSPAHEEKHIQLIKDPIRSFDKSLNETSKLLKGSAELNLFEKLKNLFVEKKDKTDYLLRITKSNPHESVGFYKAELIPLYAQVSQLNKALLHQSEQNDQARIALAENRLATITQINFWISGILIVVMILLGINIIKIARSNRKMNHQITKAIIKTQEDERFEIGSELHDNVCQVLAATGISLSRLKNSLTGPELELYDQSMKGIKLATQEIRNLSHRLAPAFFDNTTLEEAFQGLLKSFNVRSICKVYMHFDFCERSQRLNTDLQLNLYRILQEQLRNILRYAECTVIEITVSSCRQRLKMRIADNGKGFDLHTTKGGIGLANMKRRAELFGGKMHVRSSRGNGTEIIVDVPV